MGHSSTFSCLKPLLSPGQGLGLPYTMGALDWSKDQRTKGSVHVPAGGAQPLAGVT